MQGALQAARTRPGGGVSGTWPAEPSASRGREHRRFGRCSPGWHTRRRWRAPPVGAQSHHRRESGSGDSRTMHRSISRDLRSGSDRTHPTTRGGHLMFTLPRNGDQTDLDTVLEVVQVAHLDDPVYVSGRGWMIVLSLQGGQHRRQPASRSGERAAPVAGDGAMSGHGRPAGARSTPSRTHPRRPSTTHHCTGASTPFVPHCGTRPGSAAQRPDRRRRGDTSP